MKIGKYLSEFDKPALSSRAASKELMNDGRDHFSCWLTAELGQTANYSNSDNFQNGLAQILEVQWRNQKKGKSSEFHGEDDGQVQLSPAVKIESHDCRILTSKITDFWVKIS